ncbi:MAG: hypothetical protein ACOC44_13040 [Promethearchaeia archaeon]
MTLRFIYLPSSPFVMYSIGVAAQLLGVCRKTLRRGSQIQQNPKIEDRGRASLFSYQ